MYLHFEKLWRIYQLGFYGKLTTVRTMTKKIMFSVFIDVSIEKAFYFLVDFIIINVFKVFCPKYFVS